MRAPRPDRPDRPPKPGGGGAGPGREDGEGAPHGASGRHADGDTDPTKDLAAASAATQQRVAAAKNYIEQHYKQQMKILKERKDRCGGTFFAASSTL